MENNNLKNELLNELDSQKEIVLNALNNINFSNVIYLIFEGAVYFLFFDGVFNIIRVLFPS
ncbi:TPA: hypothetical protein ACWMCQ_000704 [Staphylococcus aureus]